MAIKGKLVPQDPNDEPASVLLEHIRAEKQQLIKEGKIKKDKNDSVIFKGADNRYYEKVGSEVKDITEAIDLGCPRNWTFVRLRDLIELISGRDLLPAQYNSDKIGIPYITGASNLLNERIIINRWTDTPSVVSHKGDLLITCKGTIGEMVFNNIGDVHIARQIMSIRCIGVNSLFIMLVLKSYVSQLQSGAKSFIPGISRDDILKLPFIMPPLAEQARIVNRVEELFKQIDAIEQNQADIDTLYDEFRKRTLTLAIQGKLVPQDPNDEPASVLLERIRAEKKAKLGKKYVDSYIYKGDDNCYYEKVGTNEPVRLDNLPFDIPDSWCWARLGNIGDWGAGATPARTNSQYYGGNIPWLKTGELNNDIIYGSEEHITDEALKECSLRYCRIGDVLIAMYGATIGKLAIAGVPLTTNQACCACTPYEGIYNFYLFYFLMEEKDNFTQMGFGGAQPNISKEKIIKHLFPVPPYEEQKEIVSTFISIQNILKDEN